MIVFKWLVDEELAKNSSLHFELISNSGIKGLQDIMKMLIKIEIHTNQQVYKTSNPTALQIPTESARES